MQRGSPEIISTQAAYAAELEKRIRAFRAFWPTLRRDLAEGDVARTGCRGRWPFHAATLCLAVVPAHPPGRTKRAPTLGGPGRVYRSRSGSVTNFSTGL